MSGIRTEFDSLARAGTLGLCTLPSGVPKRGVGGPLGSLGLGKRKGECLFRYRFLPKGHPGSIQLGVQVTKDELPSPVADTHFQRAVDIFHVQRGNHAEISDLSCSFLCGALSPYKMYIVRPPPGVALPKTATGEEQFFLLLANCYGIPEAPQILYRNVNQFMLSQGFTRSNYCYATYFRGTWTGNLAIVTWHVDDSKEMFDSAADLKAFNDAMTARYPLGVKHLGDIDGQRILGQLYTRIPGGLTINIHENVLKWCGECGIVVNDETKLPASPLPVNPEPKEGTAGAELLDAAAIKSYEQRTGCVQYGSIVEHTHAHAAWWLGSARHRATKHHYDLAKRVLKSMLRHSRRGLRLLKNMSDTDPRVLEVWSDSNWAQCPHDRRSVSCAFVRLFGMPLFLAVNKQGTVTTASTGAETYSMSQAAKRVLPVRYFCSEIGLELPPTIMYVDNQAAKTIAENHYRLTAMTRHMAIRHLYIRELVQLGVFVLVWVASALNLSDCGTKALDADKFNDATDDIQGWTSI